MLKKNKKMWWAIREDVKEWVQTNWRRWKEEKPAWFDFAWQSKVPKEWIEDAEESARLDEARKKGRRRSSVEMAKLMFGRGEGRDESGASGVRRSSGRTPLNYRNYNVYNRLSSEV